MTGPYHGVFRAFDSLNYEHVGVASVGVDLVNVGTIERLLASNPAPFFNTAWTPAEQQDSAGDPERLAARWAAKESVMKALGRGLGDVDPLDVEIMHDCDRVPVVLLHGSAARIADQAGVVTIHISISHEEGWAVAFALVLAHQDKPLMVV